MHYFKWSKACLLLKHNSFKWVIQAVPILSERFCPQDAGLERSSRRKWSTEECMIMWIHIIHTHTHTSPVKYSRLCLISEPLFCHDITWKCNPMQRRAREQGMFLRNCKRGSSWVQPFLFSTLGPGNIFYTYPSKFQDRTWPSILSPRRKRIILWAQKFWWS